MVAKLDYTTLSFHFFVTLLAFYLTALIVSHKLSIRFLLNYERRTLLDGLYLFTIYALRWQLAFRYLTAYLGITIFSSNKRELRLHRFCPLIILKVSQLTLRRRKFTIDKKTLSTQVTRNDRGL